MEGKIVSHYKILKKLGGGGMGEVYKAEDIKLKRIVALKFLPIFFSRDQVAKRRFIQEAQTASSLDHPNICTIYEINETKAFLDGIAGRLFIAMAYYEGETLKKMIWPRLMNQSEVVEIAMQVAKGLAKAHHQGIIHRDIKPANIIVTKDGIAKIVDFGLARLASKSEITRPEITMGTLSYISPEQILGKQIDHRTDIWSFGVMLYEMLTGELPFKGEIDQAVIYSVLNEAPEPIKVTISPALNRIVQKSLEKNPDDRYQSMEEVIAELQVVEKETRPIRVEKTKPSIAVLPFRNMSDDEGQEYFCEGIAEELINALTTVNGLRVVARTSSFSFKGKELDIREIGRKLNVEMILEGSVRKSNSRIRITAQLISVLDGYHIWSDKFDRTLEDIFSIQNEISLSIVNELRIRLKEDKKSELVKKYTPKINAYNLYLKGRYFSVRMTKEDIIKGINYLEKSIDTDPNYAQAYAVLALARYLLTAYWFVSTDEVSSKAKRDIIRALALDPNLSEGLACRGLIRMAFEWDFEGAKDDFEKSILSPSNSSIALSGLSYYFVVTGNLDEAIKILKEVLVVNPLAVNIINNLGVYLLRAKRYEEARELLISLLELFPNHPYTIWIIGQTYILESKFEDGLRLIKMALKYSNNFSPILAALGWAYATKGEKNEAKEVLNKMKEKVKQEYVNPYLFGKVYASLGEKDKAFDWLNKAVDEKDHAILQIITDESVDNLRSDPSYKELLKKMGLYKYYDNNEIK